MLRDSVTREAVRATVSIPANYRTAPVGVEVEGGGGGVLIGREVKNVAGGGDGGGVWGGICFFFEIL